MTPPPPREYQPCLIPKLGVTRVAFNLPLPAPTVCPPSGRFLCSSTMTEAAVNFSRRGLGGRFESREAGRRRGGARNSQARASGLSRGRHRDRRSEAGPTGHVSSSETREYPRVGGDVVPDFYPPTSGSPDVSPTNGKPKSALRDGSIIQTDSIAGSDPRYRSRGFRKTALALFE
jgi:hypothetical protein